MKPRIIKGIAPKKEAHQGIGFAEANSMAKAIYEMTVMKNQFENATLELKKMTEEGKRKIEEAVRESQESFVELAQELLEEIRQIEPEKGEPGDDGQSVDEESLVERISKQIPVIDIEAIKEDIISKVRQPSIDVKSLKKEILASLPDRKADLKVIQENIEIDPLSVIDKIMALPEEKRSRLKLSGANISGYDQTIRAMQSQLGRGYLHGGGDTVAAGTNITIDNVGGKKVINSTGGGGSLTPEIPTGAIDGVNTNFVVTADPVLFYWNGQLQNPLVSPPDYTYNAGTKTITMAIAPQNNGGTPDNLISYHQ